MNEVEIKNVQPHDGKPHVIGSLPFVRFASDNKIRFGHDMGFWEGLPDDVNFYPVGECGDFMTFVGDGYGVRKDHKVSGKYGNGAVYVVKSNIPELVEWCRANFL